METKIPTDAEYCANEALRLRVQLQDIAAAPLADRREARREYHDNMANDPGLIAIRAGWIVEGCYGKGAYDMVRAWSKRSNRVAQLGVLLAALEFQCPDNFARQAWGDLSASQRTAVETRLAKVIADLDASASPAVEGV